MEPLIQIPVMVSDVFAIIMLLISAFFVEKYYIGRIAMAGNIFFAWQLLGNLWYQLPEILQGYLNFGLIIAVAAVGSYIFKYPLPTPFYRIGKLFFGSVSVLIIIFYVFAVFV